MNVWIGLAITFVCTGLGCLAGTAIIASLLNFPANQATLTFIIGFAVTMMWRVISLETKPEDPVEEEEE